MKGDELLVSQQKALADRAVAAYRFGDGLTVVGSEDWKMDTFDGKDDWTKLVYVKCDNDGPNDGPHKISFHAAFKQGTSSLDESYAYWMETGSEIGSPGAANNDALLLIGGQSS